MTIPSVMAIAAHPDDIEFLMSGTMMLLAEAGYELHYMNLSSGDCGSTQHDNETVKQMRRQEAIEAASLIGAHYHEAICDDLLIFYDAEPLRKLSAVIRTVAPTIILTHSPSDYMEDHMNTCRLAVTAAFSRCMPNFQTTPETAAIDQPVTVYHAQPYSHFDPLGKFVQPSYYVNVAGVQDKKREMLSCHRSQKQWLDESQGLDSYLITMQELDAQLGTHSSVFTYAEGWRRHLHLGFCGADDDPLRDTLGDMIHKA